MDISSFVAAWKPSLGERANKDSFLRDLCAVLGVPGPDPKTGDPDRDRYVFEREAILLHGGERQSVGFIDLYKHGCFVLEAKQGSEADSKKIGTARRNTPQWHAAMQDAFGQARTYTDTIEPPPPFVIVVDIGYCFDLYASFDGTRNYRRFPDALSSRISIDSLAGEPRHLEMLRAIFTDPHSLDPSKRSVQVTREIAGYLANVALSLGNANHDPVKVAQFLMRCLFTMFVEDIGLLQQPVFTAALKERWLEHPESFPGEVEELWKKMNEGGFLFGVGNIWKFNGGLFADPTALPLDRKQLGVLALAAQSDWAHVEPAIFGTLLERALDPKERHRLGAHYTPRAYVERLVRPTIEEPLRAEWDLVRAQVRALATAEDGERSRKAEAEARKIVYEFYDRLTKIRVLDPACGSGNFLFVALDLFKRIENEVIAELESLGGDLRGIVTFGRMVTPEQFLGIEIKEWAKEITELVLWIGWLQWQIRTRGYKSHPEEPILRDYHNIERRDAVLDYDRKEPLLDDQGQPVTRWDGETTKVHPVTGEDVPDETARVPVYRYVNPRKAEWPQADFIVGNPPFIGNKRMRGALGDGYVEALRAAHVDVPETADFVVYWWNQAALRVRSGASRRFGLIATNSLGQNFNRGVIEANLNAEPPMRIAYAIPDHPWVDASDGASVRISMTCCDLGSTPGELCEVAQEQDVGAEAPRVILSSRIGIIHPDLSVGADLVRSSRNKLRSNAGLAFMGVTPGNDEFRLGLDDLTERKIDSRSLPAVVRQYLIGRDLLARRELRHIIDFFGYDESAARDLYPSLYQWLLDRVKPKRQTNKRAAYRERWWLFVESRSSLRSALRDLNSYIATVRVSKFKVFQQLSVNVLPDSGIIAICLDDAFFLGVLSSRQHLTWAFAVSGTLEDRPYWNVSVAFDPFPFPDPPAPLKQRIRELGEQLDAHRKRQQELHPELTITGMYNVLEKLRGGEVLSAKEKKIHEQGLVSVLKQIHDELDAAVFDAYGWPHDLTDEQILERLVALNAERAEEERRGVVRWLRPEFQNAGGKAAPAQETIGLELEEREAAPAVAKKLALPPWPKELREQVASVRELVMSDGRAQRIWSTEDVARAFKGSRRTDVASVLEALGALGLILGFDTPAGRMWRAA